jgi:putative peptidoglycan lipid II flippase
MLLFLAIPAAFFSVVARGYIVRLLFGFGNAETANTLGWFAGTIVFSSLFMLVSRVFFAMQDTKTPLYTSLASIPINIALSVALAKNYGVSGLAMAASIVAVLETLVLAGILRRRQGNFGESQIVRGGVPMLVSGFIMAAVVYIVINTVLPLYAGDRGFITLLPKFLLILVVAAASYLVPCALLQIKEAHIFLSRLREIMIWSFNLT